jgi:CubicO group peptidase (beta-lactamase class C family)
MRGKEIQRYLDLQQKTAPWFSDYAVGVLDFKSGKSQTWGETKKFFDLASVTKILTNGLLATLVVWPEKEKYLHSEAKKKELQDWQHLLEHRAGLPAWGLLSKENWRELISSYELSSSQVLYSDFSPLRAMLEFENLTGESFEEKVRFFWQKDIFHWMDLSPEQKTQSVVSGERFYKSIQGEVHDPNAYVVREFLSHAGAFATLEGTMALLQRLEQKYSLIDALSRMYDSRTTQEKIFRFLWGWDQVTDPVATLAGRGASSKTLGHLGFTGTSVWIDLEKRKASLIFTNATLLGWNYRQQLNDFRRELGQLIWGA